MCGAGACAPWANYRAVGFLDSSFSGASQIPFETPSVPHQYPPPHLCPPQPRPPRCSASSAHPSPAPFSSPPFLSPAFLTVPPPQPRLPMAPPSPPCPYSSALLSLLSLPFCPISSALPQPRPSLLHLRSPAFFTDLLSFNTPPLPCFSCEPFTGPVHLTAAPSLCLFLAPPSS